MKATLLVCAGLFAAACGSPGGPGLDAAAGSDARADGEGGTATCPCGQPVAHGSVSCGNGCNLTCSVGYLNCNGNYSDGCESATDNDPRNCGACGNDCRGGGCINSACGPVLIASFDGPQSEGSEGTVEALSIDGATLRGYAQGIGFFSMDTREERVRFVPNSVIADDAAIAFVGPVAYWADGAGTVRRMDLSASVPSVQRLRQINVVDGTSDLHLEIRDGVIYYNQRSAIEAAPLDQPSVAPTARVTSYLGGPVSFVVNAGGVFYVGNCAGEPGALCLQPASGSATRVATLLNRANALFGNDDRVFLYDQLGSLEVYRTADLVMDSSFPPPGMGIYLWAFTTTGSSVVAIGQGGDVRYDVTQHQMRVVQNSDLGGGHALAATDTTAYFDLGPRLYRVVF